VRQILKERRIMGLGTNSWSPDYFQKVSTSEQITFEIDAGSVIKVAAANKAT